MSESDRTGAALRPKRAARGLVHFLETRPQALAVP